MQAGLETFGKYKNNSKIYRSLVHFTSQSLGSIVHGERNRESGTEIVFTKSKHSSDDELREAVTKIVENTAIISNITKTKIVYRTI